MKKGFGFTLMEMIVALGVFSVAITIALAGFVNILDMQKRADAIRITYDSIDFVMEIMSRDIRTGIEYCMSSFQLLCSPTFFHFTPASDTSKTVSYQFDSINKKINIAIVDKLQSIQASDWKSFTPSGVVINKLGFKGSGYGPDSEQPMVTVIIQAEVAVKQGAKVQLNLQTTVTQREIDS
jgi:prepilin-type N-terminal cleavage/methylation domain-containing protein